MSALILAIVAVIIIVVFVLLSLNYKGNQGLNCPYCQLAFTTDIFYLKQSALVSCPFCHRWMVVTRVEDRNIVKKLFTGQEPPRP